MKSANDTMKLPGAAERQMANAIRVLAMDAVEQANSGHPGMPMGMADVAAVLFGEFLSFNPKHPDWPNRDRFILSAGHGSMLLYALLHLTGYEDVSLEDIRNFRQLGAKTAGHPEYGHAPGIETTTGPLGQGLANGVGMALAERMANARFGDALISHYTYVIAGDGCLMEGISQEAISLAGHLQLGKLIVLFDDNGISIDGPTSLAVSEDTTLRFASAGWNTISIDGHDEAAVREAIAKARDSSKPTLVACKTNIAHGAPNKAGKSSSHGSPLGKDEIAGARMQMQWEHAPFELPQPVVDAWRKAGMRCDKAYAQWAQEKAKSGEEFHAFLSGALPAKWKETFENFRRALAEKRPHEATRKSSQEILEALNPVLPQLIGGSADLSGSNNTKTKTLLPVSAADYSGRYIHYGVREHAMAAAMNGIALYGGFIPYGGTFLVFTDYCRPAIRLSALMGLRVIYVMTHDSIGVGEDGPTHQPVEHLASLRAIPGLQVFRPCDAMETAECWALAIESAKTPSVLALTRQNLPTLRIYYGEENLCARGGYVLSASSSPKTEDPAYEDDVTIIATGSEVEIAVAAQKQLAEKRVSARVVSLPCWELFDAQPRSYRETVLGKTSLKVAVEAAVSFGWERYIGTDGIFVGMPGFGASGPAPELYRHFGITAEAIVQKVLLRLDAKQ